MFRKSVKTLGIVAAGLAFAASSASAALTVDVSQASTDISTAATALVAVIALVWGIRRVFGLLGR